MDLCPPCKPTTYRKCSKNGQENARGRWAIKNVRKQGRLGKRPGAVGTSHRQTRARSHACVRVHVHVAVRARDSGRPVSRRLVATVSFSAWQPRQPSYTFILRQGITPRSNQRHTPFELPPLLIRFIWNSALEDRAEEQESPCAIVQVLIAHARSLQDVVYDLYAVGTRYVSL